MLETLFAICICIVGLVLFSHLIGNMQVHYLSLYPSLYDNKLHRLVIFAFIFLYIYILVDIFTIVNGEARRMES